MKRTLDRINEEKIVAIIRLDNTEHIEDIVKSLYKGGIRVIEVTLNTPGALTCINKMKENYNDLVVGAGTVLDSESAGASIRAGADFLLAPTLKKETIETGNRYNIPVIPGIMSPTEALTAYEYGAQHVKVFPAPSVGENFAKDLNGPLPFLNVMAVGGITVDNAARYFKKNWNSVGIGSSLVSSQLIADRNFDEITARAEQFIQVRDQFNTY
ncbi:bifunctional 2-keto-4-hydroxyglutarate aldolase/2-keto-3-deoxy-6-phosphogluconate aldolase [Halobacillus andaensis]|uniref:Bifunctional 2-keto-4-hydroxyglutarate aldolase/2-keto-3-deoxy-6-phosphogluconate aldolase n=1 Tax=Halobacillus andaensis TaxID=1176239 RepID=A0A917B4A2_HALAA|nr:bifunctional 4-hydroxy-2-oxoglutarate aldolase/2-dehydro-3-deoxy-phosphogluconate aldolase [Halobacillus andaensis]MBP2004325.1 2-dehydro-3-deoxyphosphogluconate aldolase/(4S)-4-hydroxy-2-oxoglutarate aldolase [Halobacillus andaensis]GGF22501.1 bifunctional 2-keto-4-hydroxyglutarate aldolase/2-keto-3-deoxy-6-phosphogluconate aldolase [Halobacillus andaensis]